MEDSEHMNVWQQSNWSWQQSGQFRQQWTQFREKLLATMTTEQQQLKFKFVVSNPPLNKGYKEYWQQRQQLFYLINEFIYLGRIHVYVYA